MMSRKWVTTAVATVSLMRLCACDDAQEAPRDLRLLPEVRALAEFLPELRPVDSELDLTIAYRQQYVPRLAIDPELSTSRVTTADLRSSLESQQPYVIELLQLSGRLPDAAPKELDDEIALALVEEGDAHLELFDARIAHAIRLLQADAIRAWDDEQFDSCAERIAAAFEFASFQIAPSDETRMKANRIWLILSLKELQTLVQAGLMDSISADSASRMRSVVPTSEWEYLPDPRLLAAEMKADMLNSTRSTLADVLPDMGLEFTPSDAAE